MSIFRKSAPEASRGRVHASSGRGPIPDSAISIIGPGMVIEGDIVTEGMVRVEGELRGTVRAGKAVIVGKEGRVEGNIITEDAVIGGAVNGSIVARNRLELQNTSAVVGEIHTRAEKLKLDEGARFAGRIDMSDMEGSPRLAALPRPPAQSDGSEGAETEDGGAPPEGPFEMAPASSNEHGR